MIYKKHALTAMARIIRWLGSISAAWSYISDAVVTSVRPAIAFRDCRRRSASKRRSFLASAVIGEWRLSGERKYYLSILPANANLKALAATIKARLVCEQAHQQMKEELSLDHFEGRSWQGLHRHALMTMIAYAFLQHQRLKQTKREKKNQSWPSQLEQNSDQICNGRSACRRFSRFRCLGERAVGRHVPWQTPRRDRLQRLSSNRPGFTSAQPKP
jgi:hypothetical protein